MRSKLCDVASLKELTEILAKKKHLRLETPSIHKIDGGIIFIKSDYDTRASVGIAKHPNCCGAKLIHTAHTYNETTEEYEYLLRAAVLWCKESKNASATYIAAAGQGRGLHNALVNLGFENVQTVYNPKSRNKFSTYIIDVRKTY